MKREEERRSVWYIVFLFPTFLRSVSHTLLFSVPVGGKRRGGRKGEGVVDRSQSLLTPNVNLSLQEDDSSYLLHKEREKDVK